MLKLTCVAQPSPTATLSSRPQRPSANPDRNTRVTFCSRSARLIARWRRSPAALAVASGAGAPHVRFRSPGRRESFRAPPPAPAGDTHRCTLLHGRVCTPTCGAGTAARGAGAARRARFAPRHALNHAQLLRRVSAGGERGLAAAADPLLTRRSIMVSCTGLRTEAHGADLNDSYRMLRPVRSRVFTWSERDTCI